MRVDRIEDLFADTDGERREFYMLTGQDDTVTISEFPDDETAAQAILSVTEQGNVSSETVKALSREATRDSLEGIP